MIADLGHGDAVRSVEHPALIEVLIDPEAAFVHERVVLRAQQHQIIERRVAAVRPVLDMVNVQVPSVIAPGERAAVMVARFHRALDSLGNDA